MNCISLSTIKYINLAAHTNTITRTTLEQSIAMNFSPFLKSRQILSQIGNTIPSIVPNLCYRRSLTDKCSSNFSMIAIFDEDGGGDVDFQEFVSGLSAFSSKGNKDEKLHFAFKVYDIDRDGYISNGELFIVLKMMVGSNLKDMQLQQVRHQAGQHKRTWSRIWLQ